MFYKVGQLINFFNNYYLTKRLCFARNYRPISVF